MSLAIGNKIKKIRELKNYTQEYMAERLEMTQAGYSKIERDESDISFTKLNTISDILEVKLEDLISFDEKYVFNIMNNQIGIKDLNLPSALSAQERKLFEDQIQSLKDEVTFLRSIVEKLK
jgi:transcriptional regulator with XRE-family HTH domain